MDVTYSLLCALLFYSVTVFAQNCVPTFLNNEVEIELSNQKLTTTVTGCLVGNQLPRGNIDSINIKAQVIPSLNSGAISNIQQKFQLHIIHNEIEVIRKNAFRNLPRLQNLHLDHNHIASVEPYAFENLQSIEGVYLSNNNIDVIKKDTFVNLPKLTDIFINNNKLKKFDQNWFVSTPMLIWLVLNDNQIITALQRAAFQDLRSLTTIDFTNNNLSYIHPEAFYGLNQLGELSLGENELTSFEEVNLSYSSAMYRLSIEHNKFTYLSPRFFNAVRGTMTELFIQGNPLQCACVDDLVLWASNNNITLFWKCEEKEVYCVFPLTSENDCVKRAIGQFNSSLIESFRSDCTIE
ncbi:hypothetical protein RI129_009647 [Pyrocoelia pectoralis]|uniref:Uncharacterized protein n=1 Tax=Pyrocoelia pectoralis TaxID=417401 RepID=A0AAN7V2J2_9COLE